MKARDLTSLKMELDNLWKGQYDMIPSLGHSFQTYILHLEQGGLKS